MKIHVEENVCRQGTDAAAAEAVDALLSMEWEVREFNTEFRIIPVSWQDEFISIAIVRKREGRLDVRRKIADAVAMLPRIIRLLDEAGLCIEELLELLPADVCIPPRVAAFLSRIEEAQAAAAEEEGGAV